jgi:hypothetical protein
MSSIKARNVLLMVFVVLTIIFGSLFTFEFFQVQKLKTPNITTSITTVTSTSSTTSTSVTTETLTTTSIITASATVPNVPEEGQINFGYMGTYAYKKLGDLARDAKVTFRNVTFSSIPSTEIATGCVIRNIWVTFPDGTSEKIGVGWCMFPKLDMAFTNHSNPKAGVILSPGDYQLGDTIISSPIVEGFYLLVSE